MKAAMDIEVQIRTLIVGGLRVPTEEVGMGTLMLCLSDGSMLTKTHHLLAAHRQIVRLTMSALAGKAVEGLVDLLGDAVAPLGSVPFDLVAEAAQSSLALGFVLRHPTLVRSLTMLGPRTIAVDASGATGSDVDLITQLGGIDVPTLAVFGTRDRFAPPEVAPHYRRYIGRCNLSLVYDASEAMLDERPVAVAALVRDFLDRLDLFLVRRESDIIYP